MCEFARNAFQPFGNPVVNRANALLKRWDIFHFTVFTFSTDLNGNILIALEYFALGGNKIVLCVCHKNRKLLFPTTVARSAGALSLEQRRDASA